MTNYEKNKRAKNIIQQNVTMIFYKKEQLYLETDVFGVDLVASNLQVSDRMQFQRNEALYNAPL